MHAEIYTETRRACFDNSKDAEYRVCIHGNSVHSEAKCIEMLLDSEVLADYPHRAFTDFCGRDMITYAVIGDRKKVAVYTSKSSYSGRALSHISMRTAERKPFASETAATNLRKLAVLESKCRDCFRIADSAALSCERILKRAFLYDKCDKAVRRLIVGGLYGKSEERTLYSGYVGKPDSAPSYPEDYLPCFIKDKYGVRKLFFDSLFAALPICSKTVYVTSPHESKIASVLIHDGKLAFISYNDETALSYEKSGRKYKILNLTRFIDTDILKESKAELKFLRKCESELESKGIEVMGESAKLFDEYERTQSEFDAVDAHRIADNLAESIREVLSQ